MSQPTESAPQQPANKSNPVATAGIVLIAVVAVLSFVLYFFVPFPMTCKSYSPSCKEQKRTYCDNCKGAGVVYELLWEK
jgi:hypothetical protein